MSQQDYKTELTTQKSKGTFKNIYILLYVLKGDGNYHLLLCTVLCTMYYVLCTMYFVLCTIYYELYTMYYVLCTIYYVLYTIYYVLCTMYYELNTMYYVLCTKYYVLCSMYYVLYVLTLTKKLFPLPTINGDIHIFFQNQNSIKTKKIIAESSKAQNHILFF